MAFVMKNGDDNDRFRLFINTVNNTERKLTQWNLPEILFTPIILQNTPYNSFLFNPDFFKSRPDSYRGA